MPPKPDANTDRWYKCVVLDDPTVHLADALASNEAHLTLCGATFAYTTSTPVSMARLCEACRSRMYRLVMREVGRN